VDGLLRGWRRSLRGLAGLVFVAVSINVDRILKFQGLPNGRWPP
jgi:hypothetical protein